MKSYVVAFSIIAAAAVFFWWRAQNQASAEFATDLGSYPYQCDDTFAFTMVPGPDMATIRIEPRAAAHFAPEELRQDVATSSAVRFVGTALVMEASGETVTIIESGRMHRCNPVPNQNDAPFNFGDSVGVDMPSADAIRSGIIGTWRSVQDPKFVRRFEADGTVTDIYDGENTSTDTWGVAQKQDADTLPEMVAAGAPYVRLTGDAGELLFTIDYLTADSLEMMYLARGSVLQFERIQ